MALPTMDVKLRKFDMSKMPQDAVCVFIGRRRTGKSTLVKDLLYHHQNMPFATVISGTEESNSFYKSMVPKQLIFGEYSPVILANFCRRQKLMMAQIQQDVERFGPNYKSKHDPRAFMILDDCMYDDAWTHDKNIRYLFMNGRWLKTFFLATMQYPLGIQPALRSNVDFVFILKAPYMSDRKKIFENYGSAFPSFEIFCQTMDQCTQNYECLVIDNTSLSNKLEDCVFWYKAEIHNEPFRVCSPQIWQQSELQERNEDGNSFDPNAARKLRGPPIQIRKV
jgi:hypothetical protein